MPLTPKKKNKWFEKDVQRLRILAETCQDRQELAKRMKRTEKSIERKADKLKLILPSKYQRHYRGVAPITITPPINTHPT